MALSLADPPAQRLKLSQPDASQRFHLFSFPDGDIILEIEGYQFRVHTVRLKCSLIFSDMLQIPQPSNPERVEGAPLVHLMDNVKDWLVVFKWLYNRE